VLLLRTFHRMAGLGAVGLGLIGANDKQLHPSWYAFTGWNTAAGGTGTANANGNTYPFSAMPRTVPSGHPPGRSRAWDLPCRSPRRGWWSLRCSTTGRAGRPNGQTAVLPRPGGLAGVLMSWLAISAGRPGQIDNCRPW
jgi:hypothetical protein